MSDLVLSRSDSFRCLKALSHFGSMILLLLVPLSLLFLVLAVLCYRRGFRRHVLVLTVFAVLCIGLAGAVVGLSWYIWINI